MTPHPLFENHLPLDFSGSLQTYRATSLLIGQKPHVGQSRAEEVRPEEHRPLRQQVGVGGNPQGLSSRRLGVLPVLGHEAPRGGRAGGRPALEGSSALAEEERRDRGFQALSRPLLLRVPEGGGGCGTKTGLDEASVSA